MAWKLNGTYFENCACDMVCPCTTSGLTMPADQERCRYSLVRRSRFVPQADCLTPVPEWKRSEWAVGALPEHDPARDPGEREVLGR